MLATAGFRIQTWRGDVAAWPVIGQNTLGVNKRPIGYLVICADNLVGSIIRGLNQMFRTIPSLALLISVTRQTMMNIILLLPQPILGQQEPSHWNQASVFLAKTDMIYHIRRTLNLHLDRVFTEHLITPHQDRLSWTATVDKGGGVKVWKATSIR